MLNRLDGKFLIPSVATSSTSDNVARSKEEHVFLTAVVKEFYYDPRTLTQKEKDTLKQTVKLSAVVDKMPINSIHCLIIQESRREEIIAYPFFSQHLCVPVKPGEQVWVIKERNMCYWICRKTSDYEVDDLNYTHMDRVVNGPSSSSPSAVNAWNNKTDEGEFPEGKTQASSKSSVGIDNSYKQILDNSSAYQTQFRPEPVPRLVKRPGDFVIQGSNNTSIILGSDENNGSIDIVAGRKISSNTITNQRSYDEIDKSKSAKDDGPRNFVSDLSRSYMTVNGNVDVSFDINVDGIDGSGTAPAVVLKSDQIRLVARQDVKITVGDTGAGIVLKSNGEIVIVPSESSVVKIGGDDADKAILCQQIIPGSDLTGNVKALPVVSTMGGVIGESTLQGTGFFASKILVK